MTLTDLINNPTFAELLEVTPEQKELNDKLFNTERAKRKQSFSESMRILSSGENK